MKTRFPVAMLFAALVVSSLTARAQDVIKISPEHNKIVLENEHVRVIENTLAPGEKDAMHTHPSGWYYVKLPGTMKMVHADGRLETWKYIQGEGGWLQTMDPHTSENIGKTTLVYVLVEVKSAAKAHAKEGGKGKACKSGRQMKSTFKAFAVGRVVWHKSFGWQASGLLIVRWRPGRAILVG